MKTRAFITLTVLLSSVIAASAADKADQNFMQKAMQGNFAEIQMGQLAQQKGQSDEVKSYGQMLVTDHTASNEDAKKIADQMGMTPPTEPSSKQKAMYNTISKLSGAAFDRSFSKEMVADHKKDIAEFKSESKKKNAPAAHFAQQTLPTLQKHLDAAEKLEKGR